MSAKRLIFYHKLMSEDWYYRLLVEIHCSTTISCRGSYGHVTDDVTLPKMVTIITLW